MTEAQIIDALLKILPALLGTLVGGGIVWGVAKTKIEHLERDVSALKVEAAKDRAASEEKILRVERSCAEFERFCRASQGACSINVHQRLDEIVRTMADQSKEISFIAGTLKGAKG